MATVSKYVQLQPPAGKSLENRKPASADAVGLREMVFAALRTVFDPEIPVNIVDLGLIYDLSISGRGEAHIKMTLTAPGCPVAGTILRQVENAARNVAGVTDTQVELVWDPPWTKDRMSDAAQLDLDLL